MALLIGWDVSTAAIGVCVRTAPDGEIHKLDVLFPKGKNHQEKHRDAAKQVRKFMWDLEPEFDDEVKTATHVVEQCLGGFSGGMSSAQTKMALAAMNAVVTFVLSDDWGEVIHILPVTTKAITKLKILPEEESHKQPKKAAVIRMMREAIPEFPYQETDKGNWVNGTDDIADAWLLTVAGGRILTGQATLPVPKKRGRKNKDKVDRETSRKSKARKPTEG
jgi:hypothetical protein